MVAMPKPKQSEMAIGTKITQKIVEHKLDYASLIKRRYQNQQMIKITLT